MGCSSRTVAEGMVVMTGEPITGCQCWQCEMLREIKSLRAAVKIALSWMVPNVGGWKLSEDREEVMRLSGLKE